MSLLTPGVKGQNIPTGCRLWLQPMTTGLLPGSAEEQLSTELRADWHTCAHAYTQENREGARGIEDNLGSTSCCAMHHKTGIATPSTGQSLDDSHAEEFIPRFCVIKTQNSYTVFAFEAAATHFACYFDIYLQKWKIISLVQLLSGILQFLSNKNSKDTEKKNTSMLKMLQNIFMIYSK